MHSSEQLRRHEWDDEFPPWVSVTNRTSEYRWDRGWKWRLRNQLSWRRGYQRTQLVAALASGRSSWQSKLSGAHIPARMGNRSSRDVHRTGGLQRFGFATLVPSAEVRQTAQRSAKRLSP